MWFFYSILTAVFLGFGQIAAKKGYHHITPLWNTLFAGVIWVILIIPIILTHKIFWSLSPILFAAFLVAICYTIYYYSLEKGQVSLTGTVIATYPLITVVLSTFFLKEHTDIFEKLGIFLIIFGPVALTFLEHKKTPIRKSWDHWLWWAIMGAIGLGIGDFISKVAIGKSDPWTFTVETGIFYLPIGLILFFIDKKGRRLPPLHLKKFLPSIVGVFMVESSIIPFNIAFSLGLASLVSPLSSTYTILSLVLAYFLLDERLDNNQWLAIVVTILGIVFLGV